MFDFILFFDFFLGQVLYVGDRRPNVGKVFKHDLGHFRGRNDFLFQKVNAVHVFLWKACIIKEFEHLLNCRIGTIAKLGNDVNAPGANERTVQCIGKIRRHDHNTSGVLQHPIQQIQEKRQIDLMFVVVMLEDRLVRISDFIFTFFVIFERSFHHNIALTVHVFENINTLIQRNTISFSLSSHGIHHIQILIKEQVLQLGLGHVVVQIHITNVAVGFVRQTLDGRRFSRTWRAR